MKFTPSAHQQFMDALDSLRQQTGEKHVHLTCSVRQCKRYKSFKSYAEAAAAGWKIGSDKITCPFCARKKSSPSEQEGQRRLS